MHFTYGAGWFLRFGLPDRGRCPIIFEFGGGTRAPPILTGELRFLVFAAISLPVTFGDGVFLGRDVNPFVVFFCILLESYKLPLRTQ